MNSNHHLNIKKSTKRRNSSVKSLKPSEKLDKNFIETAESSTLPETTKIQKIRTNSTDKDTVSPYSKNLPRKRKKTHPQVQLLIFCF